MKAAEITEQFRLFQQEIVLAGEAVETLKRDQRAAQWETMRATLIREFDPEAS